MTASNRPNILFAIADDASHMSAYGHRFVSTPSFDRVARNGVLFVNAFTTNPKCAPSRASILTGKHTWQLEEACNHFGIFPGKFRVYPDLLEEAGYHVGFTGKGWAPGDWLAGGRTRNPAGSAFQKRTLSPPARSGINPCDYAANFRDFLENRPAGRPFCFWYGGYEPHRHYVFDEGRRGGKDLSSIDAVPPYWPDEERVRIDMLDYAYEIEWFDRHLGLMIDHLDETGELEHTLVVVTSDNGAPFPRVKGQMYEDDFHLPLAACWAGTIASGRRVDDLVSFIDLAPTFLELAGLEAQAEVAGRSLVPILRANGSGRIEPRRDRVYLGRERHDMGREGDLGYPVRCVRTSDYLYVRNFAPERWPAGNPETGFTNCDSSPTKARILELHEKGEDYYYELAFGKRPAEELYDIRSDPHCLNNLATKAELTNVKESLSQDLERELRATGDPRIFGNGDVFEHYRYTGNAKHSWANYVAGTWQPQDF